MKNSVYPGDESFCEIKENQTKQILRDVSLKRCWCLQEKEFGFVYNGGCLDDVEAYEKELRKGAKRFSNEKVVCLEADLKGRRRG